jgi:hypothetical protein
VRPNLDLQLNPPEVAAVTKVHQDVVVSAADLAVAWVPAAAAVKFTSPTFVSSFPLSFSLAPREHHVDFNI